MTKLRRAKSRFQLLGMARIRGPRVRYPAGPGSRRRAAGPRRQTSSPWFGGGRRPQQVEGRARFRWQVVEYRGMRSPAAPVGLESGKALLAVLGFTSLRWPRSRTRIAVVAFERDAAGVRRGDRFGVRLGREDEDVAAGLAVVASRSMKKTRWPSLEVWNCPGAIARQIRTALEAILQVRRRARSPTARPAAPAARPRRSTGAARCRAPGARSASGPRRSGTRSPVRCRGRCRPSVATTAMKSDSERISGR